MAELTINISMKIFELILDSWLSLTEANVFNTAEINTALSDIGNKIPDPYRKQFVKAAFTDLINDPAHHSTITTLPDDAPSWAQTAFEKKDLVKAAISVDYRDQLERIAHWIEDLIKKSADPAPRDEDARTDKTSAARQLASLNRMNIAAMLDAESRWWSRHADKIKGEVSGMTKVADVGNNYSWWRLDDQAAYKREGQTLQNCIGSIWNKSKTDSSNQYIIILKDPTLESHVAMRIGKNQNEMHEVKGLNNRPPAPAYMGYTNQVMKQLNISVGGTGLSDLNAAGYTWTPKTGIVHISHDFPFEPGPSLSGSRQLVKWTAPNNIWYRSFGGPNDAMAGNIGYLGIPERLDVVSVKNVTHPQLSAAVSQTELIAVGNLPNPRFVIKPDSMRRLKETLEEICSKLKITPSNNLNGDNGHGRYFNPGLRRYGITVENGQFTADHELAIGVSVRATPQSIASIPNPSETVQLQAIEGDPNVIGLINNPTEKVMILAAEKSEYPHKIINDLLEKLGQDGVPEQVLMAAVRRDGLSIENVHAPSEAVELAAVKQNEHAFAWICYWHAETNRGAPRDAVIEAAASKTIHAIEDLQTYGFAVTAKIQMSCAKGHEKYPKDLKTLKEILGNELDPRVKAFINQRLASK